MPFFKCQEIIFSINDENYFDNLNDNRYTNNLLRPMF